MLWGKKKTRVILGLRWRRRGEKSITSFSAEGARWIGELSLRRERREEEDISANVKIAEEEVVVGYESFSVEYLKGDIRKAASDEQGTQQRLS